MENSSLILTDGQTIAVPALVLGKQQRWILDVVSASDGRVRELYSGAGDMISSLKPQRPDGIWL
jgi:hypothetical protein